METGLGSKLGRKKMRFTTAFCPMWHPCFQGTPPCVPGRSRNVTHQIFQSVDLLQTHVHRTHQLKYSSAELIRQTDENPGQNSLKPRKHLNPDPYVWAQALALISFKRVRVAAEYLTAPCWKVACLKAGSMLLKWELPAKGPVPQPSKQVKLSLPLGRRETSTSYSLHKTLPLIYEQHCTLLTAILTCKPNTSLCF